MKKTSLFYKIPFDFDVDQFTLSFFDKKTSDTYRGINHINSEFPIPLTLKQQIKYEGIRSFTMNLLSELSSIDYEKEDGVRLNSRILKRDYWKYSEITNKLVVQKVINRSDDYFNSGGTDDGISKKYSLKPEYRNKFKKVWVSEKKWFEIYKRITKEVYTDRSQTQKIVLRHQYEMITRDMGVIEPDWISLSMEITKVEKGLLGLTKIRQGVFDIKRKGKGNRLYHVLCEIPKEFRKYIVHKKYGEMVGVDVSSSHLTILCGIKEFDRERLQDLLSQDFYTSISDGKYPRETIKIQFMKYLYGSNYEYKKGRRRRRETELDRCMKLKLPNLHRYIMDMSKINKTKLSHLIMEIESDLIVSGVGGELVNRVVPFYTVHDCVYVPRQFTEMVQKLIVETFQREIHVTPRVKIG